MLMFAGVLKANLQDSNCAILAKTYYVFEERFRKEQFNGSFRLRNMFSLVAKYIFPFYYLRKSTNHNATPYSVRKKGWNIFHSSANDHLKSNEPEKSF